MGLLAMDDFLVNLLQLPVATGAIDKKTSGVEYDINHKWGI
jgi:hypothetical protein